MLKTISAVVAGASLLACLGVPIAYFQGSIEEAMFHWLFALTSICWFVSAIVFSSAKKTG